MIDRRSSSSPAFRWDGVAVREYKTGDVPYRDVTSDAPGEGSGEEPFNFVTRYFEIPTRRLLDARAAPASARGGGDSSVAGA